jgi:hypothetical protein
MTGNTIAITRLAGYAALCGAITMLVGAALWGASGTDLWAALDKRDMAGYLIASAEMKSLIVANLSVWIIGVLILGVAGAMMTEISSKEKGSVLVARVCFGTAVPLAIISFIAMLAVVVQVAPDTSASALSVASVVGWIGARADDLATALIVGAVPFFVSRAGRGEWVPGWLARWGYAAGVVGVLSLVVLYLPGLSALGFLIVPVGIGWMLAAGVVLLRRGRVQ